MKIKVEIDLEELIQDLFEDYDPDEGIDIDLRDDIKNDIVFKAKQAVLKEVKEPLRDEINSRVKILVKDAYADEVNAAVKEYVKKGKVKGRYHSDPEMSVDEWIKSEFDTSISNNELVKIVRKQADIAVEEIKGRHDMMFATQLVMKMNEQGLLKKGVMNSLKVTEK